MVASWRAMPVKTVVGDSEPRKRPERSSDGDEGRSTQLTAPLRGARAGTFFHLAYTRSFAEAAMPRKVSGLAYLGGGGGRKDEEEED
jgi:hypothetical protein